MKVKYSHEEGVFSFVEKDYVTIVVRYLYVADTEEELYSKCPQTTAMTDF